MTAEEWLKYISAETNYRFPELGHFIMLTRSDETGGVDVCAASNISHETLITTLEAYVEAPANPVEIPETRN